MGTHFVGVKLTDTELALLDAYVTRRGCKSRSEAIRFALRLLVEELQPSEEARHRIRMERLLHPPRLHDWLERQLEALESAEEENPV